MSIIDYNGEGRWSRAEILRRYSSLASQLGVSPRDLSPIEHEERGRKWVYPVMSEVIEGIEAGDAACVVIGIEFIEEDARFPFGKILKSNTARALRRANLTDDQKERIRRRVFAMLRDGHVPHEYKEYAKLVRRIGFDAKSLDSIPASDNPYVMRFYNYFAQAATADK
jgi:hypothetical protein